VLGGKTWSLLDTAPAVKEVIQLSVMEISDRSNDERRVHTTFFLSFKIKKKTLLTDGPPNVSGEALSLSLLHGSMGIFGNSTNTRARNSRHHSLLRGSGKAHE